MRSCPWSLVRIDHRLSTRAYVVEWGGALERVATGVDGSVAAWSIGWDAALRAHLGGRQANLAETQRMPSRPGPPAATVRVAVCGVARAWDTSAQGGECCEQQHIPNGARRKDLALGRFWVSALGDHGFATGAGNFRGSNAEPARTLTSRPIRTASRASHDRRLLAEAGNHRCMTAVRARRERTGGRRGS
jgi:hypothetical protein